jgi:ectoine hydroxylase-related dioxygenase (phytanoyl-CoA dioxygenase family)
MTVADARDALSRLGVHRTDITAAEREHLDRDGFVILKGILTSDYTERCARRLDELIRLEGPLAGSEAGTEEGTVRLANLVDKDPVFEICVTNRRLLAVVDHVLGGDLKLSGLNCRVVLPGGGEQELHPDWGEAVPRGSYQACNSIWCIDEFTADNGATRVVPGSHLSERMPPQPGDPDADAYARSAVQATAPPGAVIVLNAHLWHCGSLNRTSLPRRALHSYFIRRDNPQQQEQRRLLSAATMARLSPATRFLLDV